ncbi:MAG: 2-oxoacid:acceptor oxidoreductase family protein [Patescibacteria group bacterium]|nr:2-oxoacid:acceptor oxidoreductase family protein [Patescibacteria group bacterium]
MIRVLIAGEGGQGVQLIAEVLAKAAYNLEKYSLYIPNFGVEQRGGVSLAFIQVSNHPIFYPKFAKADFAVIMCERAKQRIEPYLTEETKVISDLDSSKINFPQRVHNVFILGLLLQKSGVIPINAVQETLEEVMHKKFIQNPEIKKFNFEALRAGFEFKE